MRIFLSKPAGVLVLGMLLASGQAHATRIPKLAEFFRQHLEQVSEAVEVCQLADDATTETWDFERFFLDINPYVSFGIPGVVNVQVSPEVQFVWARSGD